MMASEAAMKRRRNKWRDYLKKREEQNWSKMSYYDKVHPGDLVEATEWDKGTGKFGLVVATADTVDYSVAWGDTHVLWSGQSEPTWELSGGLEVVS
tara:strand:+ start:171 stop:458 length:288 start_codon:yes stop_codon:yes gene_type:complete